MERCLRSVASRIAKANYASQDKENKITVFRLTKNPIEREAWAKVIPTISNLTSKEVVICEMHFENKEKIKVKGRERPKNPPTVLNCVQPSLVPTKKSPLRPYRFFADRNKQSDQLKTFHNNDTI